MSTSPISSLLTNDGFKRDLPSIATLGEGALELVRELLREFGEHRFTGLDERLDLIAHQTKCTERAVAGAWGVATVILTQGESPAASAEELISGTKAQLSGADTGAFERFLRGVANEASLISTARIRRMLVAEGGKTVGSVSIVTDLRIRTDAPNSLGTSGSATTKIVELIPLTIVKLSFASADDGDDCVFQLLPSELDELIGALQAARKRVDASREHVFIRSDS